MWWYDSAMRSEPGLRRRVRRAGFERVGLLRRSDLDRAVHLVGADVHDATDLEAAGGVHHHVGAEAVGVDEVVGADDRPVDVALGGEVHDRVVPAHRVLEVLGVADVALHELVARVVVDVAQRREVAGVGERVVDGDRVVGGGQHVAHVVRADEPGTAGDEDSWLPAHVRRRPVRAGRAVGRSARAGFGWSRCRQRRVGDAPVGLDRGVVPRHPELVVRGCSSRRRDT